MAKRKPYEMESGDYTYNGKPTDLRYINIDAKAGEPNTFWVSQSGKYYRKYKDAKADDATKAVNPKRFMQNSFLKRNKKAIIVCGIILAFGLLVLSYFDKGKLVLNGKKW